MVALVYSGTDYECSGDLFVVFAIFKELVAFFNSIVRGVVLQKTEDSACHALPVVHLLVVHSGLHAR